MPKAEPLYVQFLDRMEYPNGAVGSMWDSANIEKDHQQLVILHNNWIRGFRAKESDATVARCLLLCRLNDW